jgi:hypothetical protein
MSQAYYHDKQHLIIRTSLKLRKEMHRIRQCLQLSSISSIHATILTSIRVFLNIYPPLPISIPPSLTFLSSAQQYLHQHFHIRPPPRKDTRLL